MGDLCRTCIDSNIAWMWEGRNAEREMSTHTALEKMEQTIHGSDRAIDAEAGDGSGSEAQQDVQPNARNRRDN